MRKCCREQAAVNKGVEGTSTCCTSVSLLQLIHKNHGYYREEENWAGGGLEETADGKAAGEGAVCECSDVPSEGLLDRVQSLVLTAVQGHLQWVHDD